MDDIDREMDVMLADLNLRAAKDVAGFIAAGPIRQPKDILADAWGRELKDVLEDALRWIDAVRTKALAKTLAPDATEPEAMQLHFLLVGTDSTLQDAGDRLREGIQLAERAANGEVAVLEVMAELAQTEELIRIGVRSAVDLQEFMTEIGASL